jgi:hypothetical protein
LPCRRFEINTLIRLQPPGEYQHISLDVPYHVRLNVSGQIMKHETAKRIADELERMFEKTAISAIEILRTTLCLSIPARKFANTAHRATWVSLFSSQPEPSKEKIGETLAIIRAFANTHYGLRALLKQTEIPHSQEGQSRKIKPEEELTVCAEIVELRAQCEAGETMQRVAVRHNVSTRTIYRIWRKH